MRLTESKPTPSRRAFGEDCVARPLVIPAKAGIQFFFLLSIEKQSFHSAFGRAGNFSLLVQRKVTKRKHPPAARSPGILPCEFARALRGSLNVHPCTCNELARIVRTSLQSFLRALAAPQGPHLGGILPQKQNSRSGSPWMYECVDQEQSGAPALHLISGPLLPRRAHGGKLVRVARRKRASSLHVYGHTFNEPRNAIANLPGEARQAWHRGRLSFAYFSLAKQRKVSRSAAGRAEALFCQASGSFARGSGTRKNRIPVCAGMTGQSCLTFEGGNLK